MERERKKWQHEKERKNKGRIESIQEIKQEPCMFDNASNIKHPPSSYIARCCPEAAG
jgi:hypothetical protein